MLVETFELTDAASPELTEDQRSPAVARLVESLNLAGQRKLLATVEGEVARCPFRRMTAEEEAVYGVCFPVLTPIERYEAGPVPLRVLEAAEAARPHLPSLYVWAPRDASFADPVLVGYPETPLNAYAGPRGVPHILARWGTSLLPFAELRARAVALLAAQWRARAAMLRGKLLGLEGQVEQLAEAYCQGNRLSFGEDPLGVFGGAPHGF